MRRVTPAWSCSACAPPTPTSRWRWPPPGDHGGQAVARHTPSLAAAYPTLSYSATEVAELDGLDLVFLALPHGRSQHLVPDLLSRVGVVVDLAADFRLHDPALYPTWYGRGPRRPRPVGRSSSTGCPSCTATSCGEPRAIAAPGCYPTAAILALSPLVRAGVVAVPGPAGRLLGRSRPRPPAHRRRGQRRVRGRSGAEAGTSTSARWTRTSSPTGCSTTATPPRWNRASGAPVLFTPHLAPMVRGILATCYGRPVDPGAAAPAVTTADAMAILARRPTTTSRFVVVTDGPPSTKATSGSNCAHLTVRVDPTDRVGAGPGAPSTI